MSSPVVVTYVLGVRVGVGVDSEGRRPQVAVLYWLKRWLYRRMHSSGKSASPIEQLVGRTYMLLIALGL